MTGAAWTEAKTIELSRLWLAEPRLSTATIGVLMGITKNEVVGKAHRIGLPGRGSPVIRDGPAATPPHERPRFAARSLPASAATLPPLRSERERES